MNQEKDLSQKSEPLMKRKIAKKILINDILSSTYIKRPGWEPSGILTRYGEISRVDIMGVIVSVSQEENTTSFLVDDGSGNILVRIFDNTKSTEKFNLGDLVNVIGRPREWESSKYIVPEIIKKIEDKKWYEVHQLELKLQRKTKAVKLPVETEDEKGEILETGPYQKILNMIAILDKGDGVDVEEIISNIKIDNTESIIASLIEEGEIFEISPGKVKLLE
jgi:RPA family protein